MSSVKQLIDLLKKYLSLGIVRRCFWSIQNLQVALKYGVQLRNLVWASSKNDVYVMHNSSVLHWSPINRKRTEVLNAARPIVPSPEVWSIHNCAKFILNQNVYFFENLHLLICNFILQAERSGWSSQLAIRNLQISSMCVKGNLLVAGGFHGEMICKVS